MPPWCHYHVLLVLALSSCDRPPQTTVARDSALDRDLTLASVADAPRPADTPLGDTARSAPRETNPAGGPASRRAPANRPSPVPVRVRVEPRTPPVPAPQPAPSAPRTDTVTAAAATPASSPNAPIASAPGPAPRIIASGTALTALTTAQLCSMANRPGDKIVANLSQEAVGPDGARLPVGTPVLVEMAEAEPPADFAFRVRGVQVDGRLIPISGQVTANGATTDRRVSKGGDKGKVVTGAVIGAILGRVLGGGTRGTVIGAAGGAAAGTVMAARNSTVEHCLPAGATITVTLTNPLVLPRAPQ